MQMSEKRREQWRRDLIGIMNLLIAKKALKRPHITLVGREGMPRESAGNPQVIAIPRNEGLQRKRVRLGRSKPRRITTLQQYPHR